MDTCNQTESSLFAKVVQGGFWVFVLRVADRIFDSVRLIVLARLLAPGDFGLLGISLLALSMFETFSQTGFAAALIQKKENTERYLDTAWTIELIRGFILCGLLFAGAPLAAVFFKTPPATPIVRVLAFIPLLSGFKNIGIVYFKKELEFHKEFIYSFVQTFSDLLVALGAVLILRNVWALVLGLLARNIAGLVFSYILHPHRPKIERNWAKAKELFGFGKWVVGSQILVFLTLRGDALFIGKLLGVTALGYYQMACRFAEMPTTEITNVISQITFPAYSKIQDNIPRLREAYLRVLQIVAFLSFPAAGLIFVFGADFIDIFLGEKWLAMVEAMRILVFAALLRSIAGTTGSIFSSVGKPKINFIWQGVRLGIMLALLYPCTITWGIAGAATAVLSGIFISNIGFSVSALKITQCRIGAYGKLLLHPLINTLVVVLVIFVLRFTLDTSGVPGFFTALAIALLLYLTLSYVSSRYLNYKILDVFWGRR